MKSVSDAIAEEDTPKEEKDEKKEAAAKPKADVKEEIKEEAAEPKELTRTLKGVMRVGVLAKVRIEVNAGR